MVLIFRIQINNMLMETEMSFLPSNLQSEHPNHFHRLMVGIAGKLFQREFIIAIDVFINNEIYFL